MAEERPERCGTCRFWQRGLSHEYDDGDCRRYPPVLNQPSLAAMVRADKAEKAYGECAAYETAGRALVCWSFPLVDADDWCGEWQPAKGGN